MAKYYRSYSEDVFLTKNDLITHKSTKRPFVAMTTIL